MKKLTASLLVSAGAIALSASLVGPTLTSAAAPSLPVTVTTNDGGVQVHSGVPGQPLLSVTKDKNGVVCVGFSYQMGSCYGGPID